VSYDVSYWDIVMDQIIIVVADAAAIRIMNAVMGVVGVGDVVVVGTTERGWIPSATGFPSISHFYDTHWLY
jgi:hypothetical protein